MIRDVSEGKWKRMRGQIQESFGKLSDDDLERVAGKFDRFVSLLQEKYGYTRERAGEEFNRQVTEYGDS
jgi:uncharacterized protein YjbJ (UPF0337 family)